MPDREQSSDAYHPTTTHAAWGAGHPRLLVTGDRDRFVHEIDCDLTYIGSADDSDLVLRATEPLHAKIMHQTSDEYVLTMMGKGETSHSADNTLRTGANFTAGPWRLVFARDEFADHGRPYGGRNGGEGAHQRRQQPRPDYAKEHPASSLTRCEVRQPGQTSGPDQVRAIGQAVLADAGADRSGPRAFDFQVINDEEAGIYEAIGGNRQIGGVTYNTVGNGRLILLAVSVFPEFRGQGIATDLIRRVLDDVRAQGKTVTNFCPVVAAFIEENPEYADLIDQEHPGAVTGHRVI